MLFGALWSVFKFDIQGAFGIAAYMVAVCAALIPLIARVLTSHVDVVDPREVVSILCLCA